MSQEYPLLDRFAGLWERGGKSLCYFARLGLDKLPEPGGYLCLCDVDVVPGGPLHDDETSPLTEWSHLRSDQGFFRERL